MRRTALAVVLALMVTASAAAAPSKSVVVKAAYNKELKTTILVDGGGLTLYLFTADAASPNSVCTPDPSCRPLWPALKAPATAGPGVKASLLGTTADGKQVTYKHHPLYYFAGGAGYGARDKKPGQVNGENLFQVWFAVSPKGAAVK